VNPAGPLIRRYEHNHFHGSVVAAKRQAYGGKYFSDKPHGGAAALKRASPRPRGPAPMACQGKAAVRAEPDWRHRGIADQRACPGRRFVRLVAVWPTRNGRPRKTSFSVALYGEAEARRRAFEARRTGLAELLRPRGE
jgi:hypothetical protein